MMLLDDRGCGIEIIERRNQHVVPRGARNPVAVGRRFRERRRIRRRAGKLPQVVPAVPTSLELQYLVPACEGAGQPHCRKGRFAPRRLEPNRFTAGRGFHDGFRQANRGLIQGKVG